MPRHAERSHEEIAASLGSPGGAIFLNVIAAMQDAEEIFEPGPEGYEALMEAIMIEAGTRIANFRENENAG